MRCFEVIVPMGALLLAGAFAPASEAAPVPCAEKSVTAGGIRSPQDIEAFVQCAYEYVQEMGFEEARRAFHEDARWKDGQFYLFVSALTPSGEQSRHLVFPPDAGREGLLPSSTHDGFGEDFRREFFRALQIVDSGWVYYTFRNPQSGLNEPKASYIKKIDWNGTDARIGAGVYRRDFPGACHASQVNAGLLTAEPSMEMLEEFVRCAALEVESKGYFATLLLESDPRWRAGSIYVFGLDLMGNQLFSGNPVMWNGGRIPEWSRDPRAMFEGRDMVGVAETFGESRIYYHALHPETGRWRPKAAFVKRVSGQGVPLLIGAGIYLDD